MERRATRPHGPRPNLITIGAAFVAAFLFILPACSGCAALNRTLAQDMGSLVRSAPETVTDAADIIVYGDSHASIIQRLTQWATAQGIVVIPSPDLLVSIPQCCYFGAQGYSEGKAYVIYQTEPFASPNMQASTLIHELAHVLHGPLVTGATGEILAETVSYHVCRDLGLDTRRQSAVYLAQYSDAERDAVYREYEKQILEWRVLLVFAAGGAR